MSTGSKKKDEGFLEYLDIIEERTGAENGGEAGETLSFEGYTENGSGKNGEGGGKKADHQTKGRIIVSGPAPQTPHRRRGQKGGIQDPFLPHHTLQPSNQKHRQ